MYAASITPSQAYDSSDLPYQAGACAVDIPPTPNIFLISFKGKVKQIYNTSSRTLTALDQFTSATYNLFDRAQYNFDSDTLCDQYNNEVAPHLPYLSLNPSAYPDQPKETLLQIASLLYIELLREKELEPSEHLLKISLDPNFFSTPQQKSKKIFSIQHKFLICITVLACCLLFLILGAGSSIAAQLST